MQRIKVKVKTKKKDIDEDSYPYDKDSYPYVNLPDWTFIREINKEIWEIEIPDDEYDSTTNKPSKEKIRNKYRRSIWDRPDVCDDIIVDG